MSNTPAGDHYPPGAPFSAPSDPRVTALEQRQADLERRIAELERNANKQSQWPWTPNDIEPYRWPTTRPGWPIPESSDDAKCHVCHGRWKDMTHYVCNHHQCPSRVSYGSSTFGGPSMAEDQLPRYSTDVRENP
jgi:hypothetical protein